MVSALLSFQRGLKNGQDQATNRPFHTNTKAQNELRRRTIHLQRLSLLYEISGNFAAKEKFFQKFTAAQIPTYYYMPFLYFKAPPHLSESGERIQYSN
jgi:hypothetical protein